MRLKWSGSEYQLSLTREELTMLLGCIAETLAYVSDVDLEAFIGWDRESIKRFQFDLLFQRRKASDARVKNELVAAGELDRAIADLGNLKELSLAQLIELFINLASLRGIAIEEGNQHADIRGSEQLNEIYKEVRSREDETMTTFLRLLQHQDEGVRLAAAEQALHVAPREATESLEQLVPQTHKARIAGSAEFRLHEWRARDPQPPH